MKKAEVILIALIISFLLITSCTDSTEPDENAMISGFVTNSLGEPVPNAKIMLTYCSEAVNTLPYTVFSFHLSELSYVKLWISHHNKPDSVIVLIDAMLNPAIHLYYWDFNNSNDQFIVSNYYDYHIKTNNSQIDKNIFLNREYGNLTGEDIENYEHFAITDDNGYYELEIDELPFSFEDTELKIYNVYGDLVDIIELERFVKIWAVHSEYQPVSIDSIYVHKSSITAGNLSFD